MGFQGVAPPQQPIDFTQLHPESPLDSPVVVEEGFVRAQRPPIDFRLDDYFTQPIAPRSVAFVDYDAFVTSSPFHDIDVCEDEEAGFYQTLFQRISIGEPQCFSFEIKNSVLDAAYFVSNTTSLERAQKMGKKDPVSYKEIWEAKGIVKHMKRKGKTLFQVEWAGRGPNGRPWPKTWEPAENLGPLLLHMYESETGISFSDELNN